VVIIGGGIAGLAAAWFLRDSEARVTVLEGSPRLGGKLVASEVAGVTLDEGAEALLARRPEGIDLVKALGLGDDLRPAGTSSSAIWTRGELRRLPRRQFMGVPADINELAASGVVSPEGVARARRDQPVRRDGDISVTAYIGGRLGNEVVDRLVDPLLGGVYAGRSDQLSLEATLGPLAAATDKYLTLTEVVGSLLPAPKPADQQDPPVFVSLAGGLGSLPAQLAKQSGAEIRTGAMVRQLTRTPDGWRLTVGSAADPEAIEADGVILALPARPASRLLAGVSDKAAKGLGEIPYASMAIITLAYPRGTITGRTDRSGYLVPAIDGRAVKAVTFSTVKWPHLPGEYDLVRCSVGRIGEEQLLQRDDAELSELAHNELAEATGITDEPVDERVTRWGGGLPQYTVGHLDRVASIRAAIGEQPGLAVAGAAYDGVGIPACVATARTAVDTMKTWLTKAASSRPATSTS
jgi:protoporphyrinogen/coproporphyrinogen III oxidase